MEQNDINQQLFARLTVQNMLLEQLMTGWFSGLEDRGEEFIANFIHTLRYKLTVPADANQDAGVDAQALQADALEIAERFFSAVRARVSTLPR